MEWNSTTRRQLPWRTQSYLMLMSFMTTVHITGDGNAIVARRMLKDIVPIILTPTDFVVGEESVQTIG